MDMIRLLLRHGADPDCVIDGLSSCEIVKRRLSLISNFEQRYFHFALSRLDKIFETWSQRG